MKKIAAIVLLGLIALGIGGYGYAYRASAEVSTVTIQKTERIHDWTGDKYLAWTDQGVFEITDSLWFGRWDSSSTYGSLEVGKAYRVKVAGWRIPYVSTYQNIIEAEPVDPDSEDVAAQE